MRLRHSFCLIALNLLLRSHRALSEEADFEREFRLMILSDDPDNMMVTVQDQFGGGESEGRLDNKEEVGWHAGVDARKDDGGYYLSYLGWTGPRSDVRSIWYHKKGQPKDSPGSQKCTVLLNHNPDTIRLDWYIGDWENPSGKFKGLDADNTINGFKDLDKLVVLCELLE